MAVMKYRDRNGNIVSLKNVKVKKEENFENQLLISTENAILKFPNIPDLDGKTRAFVNFGTLVNVDAVDLEGKVFNYMVNQNGEIVTYDKKYPTHLYTDEIIIPRYSDVEVEKTSIVAFNGKGYTVKRDESMILFYSLREILKSDNVSEWGLLLSTSLPEEEILVDANLTKLPYSEQSASKVQYTFTGTFNPLIFSNHMTVKARAYAILEKDGVQEVIYSNVITVQL